MLRFLLRELRHRGGRSLALFVGILIAASSFTALTGAARTSKLEVVGSVQHSFRSTYDILVRPKHSETSLERSRGLVRANYLSGIFGGITLGQYRSIRSVPGVEVAAPIAMLGYVLQGASVPVDLTSTIEQGQRALFRVTVNRAADRDTLRFPGEQSFYVYVTPNRLSFPDEIRGDAKAFGPKEHLPSGAKVTVCPESFQTKVSGPFDPSGRSTNDCWSTLTGEYGDGTPPGVAEGHVAAMVDFPFPFLVAAVDPAAEARLEGVDDAVVQGRYLRSSDAPRRGPGARASQLQVPVLASSQSFTDAVDQVVVERLPARAAAAFPTQRTPAEAATLVRTSPGTPALTRTITTADAYRQLLAQLTTGLPSDIDNYWTVGPTSYRVDGPSTVTPVPVTNPARVWQSRLQSTGWVAAPAESAATNFRALTPHVGSNTNSHLPSLHAVGEFDPAKLAGFHLANRAPLTTYNPPPAAPADARTRAVLHGHDLLPDGSIGGYLQAPPLMLTTLRSIPAFTDPGNFPGHTAAAAPISVVRVRVAGVKGPDSVSLARIREVAQQIKERTGLDVEITAGSSPTPITVDLPAEGQQRPALKLREGWVEKGVAVSIINAVDRESLALFGLIFVVCGLFVANAASAAVSLRTRELGMLTCLGWPAGRIFASVVAEIALVGLLAGGVGVGVAYPLARAGGLDPSPLLTGLAVPAAVVIAVLAALLPAWRASRSAPIDAVRPVVSAPNQSARGVGNLIGLALRQVRRTPGRTLVGASALAVGIAGLTVLVAVTSVFRGVVVGSLLGDAITVQVRGIDYAAVVVIVLLGASAVADVIYLDTRDRAPQYAALIAAGWDDRDLVRLLAAQGALIGGLGGLIGAVIGLLGAIGLGGSPVELLPVAVGCAVVGPVLAAVVALVPAALLARLPVAALTAEEM